MIQKDELVRLLMKIRNTQMTNAKIGSYLSIYLSIKIWKSYITRKVGCL